MPKFLWTILLSSLISTSAFLFILFRTAPDSLASISAFFFFLWLSLSLILSLPIYFFYFRKAPKLTELRLIYRRAFKLSIYFSTFITSLGILKVMGAFNLVNLLLSAVFMFALYKYTSKP